MVSYPKFGGRSSNYTLLYKLKFNKINIQGLSYGEPFLLRGGTNNDETLTKCFKWRMHTILFTLFLKIIIQSHFKRCPQSERFIYPFKYPVIPRKSLIFDFSTSTIQIWSCVMFMKWYQVSPLLIFLLSNSFTETNVLKPRT